MKKDFPVFWYESNACRGNVKSIADLVEKAKIQIGENGGFKNIDDFLDRSKKTKGQELNYGTRSEHSSDKTLRLFLEEKGVLNDFLTLWNK